MSKLNTDGLLFLASGLCACSVCVPADWTKEQIESEANRKSPTGISSKWGISEEPKFATGHENGCDCDQVKSRKHWLLNC